MDGILSIFSGAGRLLLWLVSNPVMAVVLIGGIVLIALYFLAKPWFDVVARALNVAVKFFEMIIQAFEKRWKESKAFRDFVTIGGGVVICLVAAWAIWNGGKNYAERICANNNEVLELRREVAAEKQKRVNAEFERDRNLNANVDAMRRQEELERQNNENTGEIDDLRQRLETAGNRCVYPDDEYNRVRDILRGK
jgi:hypothetical protein